MVIRLEDIKELFSLISKNVISREIAELQAFKIIDAFDSGNLEFYPKEHEKKIWDAVQYIALYSEKLDENAYLFSQSDLSEYIKENGWDFED